MGKLNFSCNVGNDRLKHATDQPTIGLILCQEHDPLLAEYRFAGIDKPLGVCTYELTRGLPSGRQSVLPTIEEIETELGETMKVNSARLDGVAVMWLGCHSSGANRRLRRPAGLRFAQPSCLPPAEAVINGNDGKMSGVVVGVVCSRERNGVCSGWKLTPCESHEDYGSCAG